MAPCHKANWLYHQLTLQLEQACEEEATFDGFLAIMHFPAQGGCSLGF